MTQRLIAIGDIHGCRTALETLIDAIAPTADDTVVTLGDYVDRGPDSKGVVDCLIEVARSTRLIGLLGNHEEMMLQVIQGELHHRDWLACGGVETLESYQFDGEIDFLPANHKQFFDSLGDYFEHDDYFFAHAAYDPDQPLEYQTTEMLRWYSLRQGLPAAHVSGKTAVVGHTAQKQGEVLDAGHLICLDTFCYGGGWLTAMDFNSGQVWQVSRSGELRA